MINKSDHQLRRLAVAVLQKLGTSDSDSARVADHMVDANLCGVDTHGIHLLSRYVQFVKDGWIVPDATPEIAEQTATSALVRGNWGFGHPVATMAMELGIEKALDQNVAVIGLVQLNHIGRLGEYAEMAAARGTIAMIWGGGYAEVDAAKIAVPYGGRENVLCTNPWSIGFPAGDDTPMVVDYATTASSQIKVANARDKDQPVPAGWIVDKQGQPSTNPNDFFDGGGLLPFGGHKGFGMMMAAEFLGRAVTGSNDFAEGDRGGTFGHSGTLFVLMKADLFRPLSDYAACTDQMQRRVRAVPPAPGFDEVLIPGDREHRTRQARLADGIPLEEVVWEQLVEVAESLGVAPE